jgi:predicted phage terminase large subunit-like protein
MTRIIIPPIALHGGQQRILESPARYKVIAAGRRFGKTLLAVEWLALAEGGALDGASVGFFAPTYKLLMEAWNDFERTLTPIMKRSNKTEMRMELITGGKIDFWTLEDKDAGRGRRYHRIVIDEAAHARYLKDAWERAISPTLTDYQGAAWFISTPNGLNYFYELFKRGCDPAYPEWASFQMPTTANPYISADELEKARRELPELVYMQEFLAEFVDLRGAGIFRSAWYRYYDEIPQCERVTIGVDLAISRKTTADYTVIAVVGKHEDKYYILDIARDRYTMQETLDRIRTLAERYNASTIAVEAVGYQQVIADELARSTMYAIKPIKPATDKVTRATPLASKYEQGLVMHPRSAAWLRAYEDELLAFPVGEHDDQVDAVTYALHGHHTTAASYSAIFV